MKTKRSTTTPAPAIIATALTVNLNTDDVASLLISAFEGGSNYWYMIDAVTEPKAYTYRTDKEKIYQHVDYPLNVGGSLKITTLEGDKHNGKKAWNLNLDTIRQGIAFMYAKYPQHFANVLTENADATTGDVFLQCCLFGEIVYG